MPRDGDSASERWSATRDGTLALRFFTSIQFSYCGLTYLVLNFSHSKLTVFRLKCPFTMSEVAARVRTSTHNSVSSYADATKYRLAESAPDATVEVSGLGAAIAVAVSTVEFLKHRELIEVTGIRTGMYDAGDHDTEIIEIFVKRGPQFERRFADERAVREARTFSRSNSKNPSLEPAPLVDVHLKVFPTPRSMPGLHQAESAKPASNSPRLSAIAGPSEGKVDINLKIPVHTEVEPVAVDSATPPTERKQQKQAEPSTVGRQASPATAQKSSKSKKTSEKASPPKQLFTSAEDEEEEPEIITDDHRKAKKKAIPREASFKAVPAAKVIEAQKSSTNGDRQSNNTTETSHQKKAVANACEILASPLPVDIHLKVPSAKKYTVEYSELYAKPKPSAATSKKEDRIDGIDIHLKTKLAVHKPVPTEQQTVLKPSSARIAEDKARSTILRVVQWQLSSSKTSRA